MLSKIRKLTRYREPQQTVWEHQNGERAKKGATAAPDQEPVYSSDQPIRSKEQDRFNRWPFAQRIAETLAGRTDPSSLVIGIYGPWGDGKSSTLYLMEEGLGQHPDVVRVRFNPWHFDSKDQLLRGFFATLGDAIGKSLSSKVKRSGGFSNNTAHSSPSRRSVLPARFKVREMLPRDWERHCPT